MRDVTRWQINKDFLAGYPVGTGESENFILAADHDRLVAELKSLPPISCPLIDELIVEFPGAVDKLESLRYINSQLRYSASWSTGDKLSRESHSRTRNSSQ